MVAPVSVVGGEPWDAPRANGPAGMVVVEEELSDGHVGGNVWDGVVGGDEFLDNPMILVDLVVVGGDES